MLKARVRIEQPEDVRLTLTVTLPLKEWKRLIDQLGNQHPSWALEQVAREAVALVEKNIPLTDQEIGE